MSIFTDGSTDLNNEGGYEIKIYHVPSGGTVKFKAWITSFSDSYQSNWNTEDVYGRMDPISTFQNTRRTISLSWDVVAADEEEAESNLGKCEKLFKMLYPSYEGGGNASNITQAPLFKIKFGNLITGAKNAAGAGDAIDSGLLGTLGGFEYSPDFESGFFTPGIGMMYPQNISLNAEFQVLHNFELGWKDKEFRTTGFPYNVGEAKITPDITATPAEKKTEPKLASLDGTTAKEKAAMQSLPDDERGPLISGGEPYMNMEQSTEGNQSTQPQEEEVTEEQKNAMMSSAACDPTVQSCQ